MTLYDLALRGFTLMPPETAHEVVFGGLRGLMAMPGAQALSRRVLGRALRRSRSAPSASISPGRSGSRPASTRTRSALTR
jgi:hypothetical protein